MYITTFQQFVIKLNIIYKVFKRKVTCDNKNTMNTYYNENGDEELYYVEEKEEVDDDYYEEQDSEPYYEDD